MKAFLFVGILLWFTTAISCLFNLHNEDGFSVLFIVSHYSLAGATRRLTIQPKGKLRFFVY